MTEEIYGIFFLLQNTKSEIATDCRVKAHFVGGLCNNTNEREHYQTKIIGSIAIFSQK